MDIEIGYSCTIAISGREKLYYWGCIDGINTVTAPKFIEFTVSNKQKRNCTFVNNNLIIFHQQRENIFVLQLENFIY